MSETSDSAHVVPVANLQEFFRDGLHSALERQQLSVEDQTEHYVVNLLTLFSRADALYGEPEGAARGKPLVVMLTESLEATTPGEQQRGLQRLGDVALFTAGFFAHSFARKLIDVDYHIAMGCRAYGVLAEARSRGRGQVLGAVFAELAAKFGRLVDALNEISDCAYQHSDRDLLRLYELWLKTGSARSYQLLKRLGVQPAQIARTAQ
ncbi:MAG TPA: hypothetical protein VLW26_02540 [Steroidobacteraceae bacterium]|nr:hypothetical protein [Steroidobacteraceae bacterium]